jgi:predicted ArsR family transcriptional regulator
VAAAGRPRSSRSPTPGATRSTRRTTTSRCRRCGSSPSRGPEAVEAFARRRVADLEERYSAAVEAAPERDRAEVLAEALTQDGYAASTREGRTGIQLCQHNCPVAHVAAEFPQLCEAETEVFARLLGRHVQRLATIANGDGVCTTHVPDPTALQARPNPTRRNDTP